MPKVFVLAPLVLAPVLATSRRPRQPASNQVDFDGPAVGSSSWSAPETSEESTCSRPR